MFGKTYELSLTRDYVRHWGVNEAVRELIQNALDSDSPFVYEFATADDGTQTLALISEFAELSARSLLLGATTKADATDKIGSFGEGFKIALLVLTRVGHPVTIWNGDRHWAPYFQYSKKYDDDILCVSENAMPHPNRGLRFLVSGLSTDQVSDIQASCLQMQDNIGGIKRTPMGDILLDQKGRLYVGGLFICTTDMDYGYNVKPEHLKLERDRQTVADWDLLTIMRAMWYATEEFERVAAMIGNGVPDMAYSRYDSPEMIKDTCYRLFREEHPGAVVAGSQAELKELVKRGMTRVVVVREDYARAVQGSSHYKPKLEPIETPTEHLVGWWRRAKYMPREERERAFNELLDTSRKWKLA